MSRKNGATTVVGEEAPVMESVTPTIAITKLAQEHIRVPILGTSPLIVHKFSEKARKQMLAKSQGQREPKQPKDPQKEYESAIYRLPGDRYGFPADGFKKATVGAARFYGKDVSMTAVKQFIFVSGEIGDDGRQMVEIVGEPEMREDVVRVGSGSDNRYRPQFWPWHAELDVIYFSSVITRDSVLSLIDAGGLAVGIGDWRPQRDGTFGQYRIDPEAEVKVIGLV